MDVHDTTQVPRNIPLRPGMVITVEPGLYIPKSSKFLPPNRSEFSGIGVRIEDDVLITQGQDPRRLGCRVLSSECPKSVSEIEDLIMSWTSEKTSAGIFTSPEKDSFSCRWFFLSQLQLILANQNLFNQCKYTIQFIRFFIRDEADVKKDFLFIAWFPGRKMSLTMTRRFLAPILNPRCRQFQTFGPCWAAAKSGESPEPNF